MRNVGREVEERKRGWSGKQNPTTQTSKPLHSTTIPNGNHEPLPINPLQPMLGTMSRDQILQIVRRWDALRLGRAQEVLLNRICIVAERHLNRVLEAMNVAVIA
jgi:hypothetical protein